MPENERRLLSMVMPGLLRPGGLQDLAAAALERTLADDPDDADALWKLAEVYRRLGDFDAARGLYGRLRVRGPDRRKAAWLHAVLNGGGAPGGVFWPAPFVWMTDFLAPEECDRLLALGGRTTRRLEACEIVSPVVRQANETRGVPRLADR